MSRMADRSLAAGFIHHRLDAKRLFEASFHRALAG